MELNHQGTVILETERLILRPFSVQDAEAMFRNWANDPQVAHYLSWQPHADISVTRLVLEEWEKTYQEKNFYLWAIELKAIKQPVGSIGTEKAKMESLRTEIGYCIGREFWNRGYTTEALSRVINFFFGEVGFNRIEATHDVLNPASGRVMQKCGMTHEGTMREVGLNKDGEFFSWQLYAILQSDWRNAVIGLNG